MNRRALVSVAIGTACGFAAGAGFHVARSNTLIDVVGGVLIGAASMVIVRAVIDRAWEPRWLLGDLEADDAEVELRSLAELRVAVDRDPFAPAPDTFPNVEPSATRQGNSGRL
jgi:hypothetical protein